MKIKASLADRGHDLYQTCPEATLALLRAERLPKRLWEPACGPGAIVRVLRGAGHTVLATDLIDYQSPDQDHGRRDFLLESAKASGWRRSDHHQSALRAGRRICRACAEAVPDRRTIAAAELLEGVRKKYPAMKIPATWRAFSSSKTGCR